PRTRTVGVLLCTSPAPGKHVRKSSGPHRGQDRGELRHEIPSPRLDNCAGSRAPLHAKHEPPQVSAPTGLPRGSTNPPLLNSRGLLPNKDRDTSSSRRSRRGLPQIQDPPRSHVQTFLGPARNSCGGTDGIAAFL